MIGLTRCSSVSTPRRASQGLVRTRGRTSSVASCGAGPHQFAAQLGSSVTGSTEWLGGDCRAGVRVEQGHPLRPSYYGSHAARSVARGFCCLRVVLRHGAQCRHSEWATKFQKKLCERCFSHERSEAKAELAKRVARIAPEAGAGGGAQMGPSAAVAEDVSGDEAPPSCAS